MLVGILVAELLLLLLLIYSALELLLVFVGLTFRLGRVVSDLVVLRGASCLALLCAAVKNDLRLTVLASDEGTTSASSCKCAGW